MKMSDYFNLPLDEHATVELCDSIVTNPDGNDQEIYAIMQVVNMHDELVEMLEDCYKALFVDLTSDNLPSCSEIRALLKKARGE